MNIWDILIMAAVAGMIVLALRAIRGRKSGCGCSCEGCSACGGKGSCPHCAGRR